MNPFNPLSVSQQLAQHLRKEIQAGQLHGEMPGVLHLAERLGVSPKTVKNAVQLLQTEGLLEHRGLGRNNRIVVPGTAPGRSLRIEMLLYDESDRKSHYWVDLQHQLLLC